MRILVVEDYPPLRDSLVRTLKDEAYGVDAAGDGEEGLWYAQGNDYDAIVLDIMLPKKDGIEVLKALRAAKNATPVLLLTALGGSEDVVRGLDAGADDYLTKPFSVEVLLARVRAMVRRGYQQHSVELKIGEITIDTAGQTVHVEGEEVSLTAREYALLEFLSRRVGEVVSRSEIWEHLYAFHSEATSNVVDVYIGYLRRKLGSAAGQIETLRGRGYRLRAGEPS
jgi:two-component system OmpR family response regulator